MSLPAAPPMNNALSEGQVSEASKKGTKKAAKPVDERRASQFNQDERLQLLIESMSELVSELRAGSKGTTLALNEATAGMQEGFEKICEALKNTEKQATNEATNEEKAATDGLSTMKRKPWPERVFGPRWKKRVTVAIVAVYMIVILSLFAVAQFAASDMDQKSQSALNNPGARTDNWWIQKVTNPENQYQQSAWLPFYPCIGKVFPNIIPKGAQCSLDNCSKPTMPVDELAYDSTIVGCGNFQRKISPLMLELTVASFVDSVSGGMLTMAYTIVLPDLMMDTSKNPALPAYAITFNIGATSISISTTNPSYTGTVSLAVERGSNLRYPLDTYRTWMMLQASATGNNPNYPILNTQFTGSYSSVSKSVYYYPSVQNDDFTYALTHMQPTPTNQNGECGTPSQGQVSCLKSQPLALNFYVKVSTVGIGSWVLTPGYQAASSGGNGGPSTLQFTFQRSAVSAIFPIFLGFLFWIVALGQLSIVLAYYYGLKKVDTPGLVTSVAPMLFVLPTIRNQMPGNPPIGMVMDFICYYPTLALCVLNFGVMSLMWLDVSVMRPKVSK